ncbi:bifunctional 4-hydroxy-2-oxoglutarate aldolase/2-dehydro-3-deoxy-phosphogluconate aldolase [Enterovirga sp.]|uniref:bifunctional 4-hydroxy-2-oxoglutarate aldolase/2-dehydro-3-deoxy-phosphogluconate aldolase n=1 Tax=Enterovirga sp. TaxID=2026350 RepID=UPI002CF2AD2E|nr:bifunctional 4-hydroxy-2-oxoglutarate aldolase/2-dehydro-3-deoxy-phosphogluconate aldolase [Enterovirga sp.]HMO29014.1 bifunctional 4-hydroxy-2-oxoglutarate aldolase/2-dehydro-3-deoxy-phosphogluconate aldolase [Enterovirga sp.]
MSHSEKVARYAALAPAIPVLTITDVEDAVPLARTLVEAGLPVAEVTLRTPVALAAMERIAREVPEAVVAAGTVTQTSQIMAVASAGANFIVTPGTPHTLADALSRASIPAMPGCSTVTEALALAAMGFTHLKFFPAGACGGAAWLKSIAGPCGDLRFCPTGGIDAAGAPAYLALPNVVCVGGSWMVPNDAVRARDWARIGKLAREAAALRRAAP